MPLVTHPSPATPGSAAPATPAAPGPLLAVAALGALGTGLAFLLRYGLVAEVGPTTGQMVTYFIPVIATIAGVALLGERLTWNAPVGAVIVLAGAALTQGGRRRRPAGVRTEVCGEVRTEQGGHAKRPA